MFFFQRGLFCAGFARSSLLGEAARTRRATPRRRRNRPHVPAAPRWEEEGWRSNGGAISLGGGGEGRQLRSAGWMMGRDGRRVGSRGRVTDGAGRKEGGVAEGNGWNEES
ncbi:hypothetical protein ALC56_02602 [Trachymyrmex septentrionalis]|uniref:Uncharacterized protein n=1 Tax=Trachymyrmex septentrionalis TaxID=34720 RepID=A0A195FQD3_9HYME|nr:hypothetical protein ALC56_02602 [Trachymyrmex septentrionalis]